MNVLTALQSIKPDIKVSTWNDLDQANPNIVFMEEDDLIGTPAFTEDTVLVVYNPTETFRPSKQDILEAML